MRLGLLAQRLLFLQLAALVNAYSSNEYSSNDYSGRGGALHRVKSKKDCQKSVDVSATAASAGNRLGQPVCLQAACRRLQATPIGSCAAPGSTQTIFKGPAPPSCWPAACGAGQTETLAPAPRPPAAGARLQREGRAGQGRASQRGSRQHTAHNKLAVVGWLAAFLHSVPSLTACLCIADPTALLLPHGILRHRQAAGPAGSTHAS